MAVLAAADFDFGVCRGAVSGDDGGVSWLTGQRQYDGACRRGVADSGCGITAVERRPSSGIERVGEAVVVEEQLAPSEPRLIPVTVRRSHHYSPVRSFPAQVLGACGFCAGPSPWNQRDAVGCQPRWIL